MEKTRQEFITGIQGVEGVAENYRIEFQDAIDKIKTRLSIA